MAKRWVVGTGFYFTLALTAGCAGGTSEPDDGGASLPPLELYLWQNVTEDILAENQASFARTQDLCEGTPERLVNLTRQGERFRVSSDNGNSVTYEYRADTTQSYSCAQVVADSTG